MTVQNVSPVPSAPTLALSELEKGELVWFDPGIGHALPGEVMEYHRPAQVLTVQAVIAGKPQVFSLTSASGLRRRQDLGHNGIEDMIQLSDLNEASLLWNLKIRYEKELIYTYVGSILVAVNPYKMYDMYGLDMVKKYEGQILGTLPPHLFAIGSAAYANLSRNNQVVVISGESGSGKTESTKLVMQYLAAVNKSPSNLITEQILEGSPLLESFGNAKTVRNDNSSRFGKYLEIYFKEGVIMGAKVTEYLLEKSRIVTQAADERNYHVFYELLTGLPDEEKLKYGLLSADKYFYLNQGGNCEIDGKYDGEDFQSLLSAMQVLGFTSEEQDTIFRILASVLHLGNVYFHRKQLKHGQEGVEIGSDAEIRWTGHLLKLDADAIKQALTTKTTEARNERLYTALNIDQALDTRDAFAKALYSSLFTWLVARINHIVYRGCRPHSTVTTISILDIFGFEDFKENSFEQLCINYANENLQFYFNKHIFKLEQQEYAKEKIQWQNIIFNDNLPVIHLLSKKPVGILHLLDDESNFPKATDLSFLEKCHYNHALNELYSRPRLNVPEFGVRHYAGAVWYNVDGFLDKNRDTLRTDVVDLLISSSLPMVSKMFSALRNTYETSKTLNKANGRFVTMKPRTPTVAARFHDSLQQLLELMSKSQPWFVRCVKPNTEKAAMKYDMPTVLEQLRYSGMLDTIRIRKLGFPVRIKFAEFTDRYRYLLPQNARIPRGVTYREVCRIILEKYGDDYQLGTTRVFLRENLERELERRRVEILRQAATVVQRKVRGFLVRRRYLAAQRGAIKIQTTWRGWRERKKYRTLRSGIIRAQALYRGNKLRKDFRLKEELKRRAEQKAREKEKGEKERLKNQKEEQDKISRASANGVGHLDVPADFAYLLNKLEETAAVHTERQVLKVIGPVSDIEDRRNLELPPDVDQHVFSKFANIYFENHVWGMKREPIKSPFLVKVTDTDFMDSLAVFKLILRFMNDGALKDRKEKLLGDYIVNKGIQNEKLRDEILCQLVNQTWRNDVAQRNEKGWLLMANCLSSFPPSSKLYKYLLKYASDHGYDGYKALCQHKLLQSYGQWSRSAPPCLLEWKSNRKKINMAIQLHFYNGEKVTAGVDSWTRCETLCENVLSKEGVAECHGWTLTLDNQEQCNGLDYVLDIISEMESLDKFPIQRARQIRVDKKIEAHIGSNRRPNGPPPKPPNHLTPPKMRSTSREQIVEAGLSRQSALNDRYFDKDSSRSRSLDDLLSPASSGGVPLKLEKLGLSHSRLNERYRSHSQSMERIQESVDGGEGSAIGDDKVEEDNFESVSQRGENRKYSINGASSDVMVSGSQLDYDLDGDLGARSEDDKISYIAKSTNSRYVKSAFSNRRHPAIRSSAMSDTSEAPSLASHVKRVRVPSQASDVDQYLDDLFNPVLDQLSDGRSIRGGSTISSRRSDNGASRRDDSFPDARYIASKIKGGGGGTVDAHQGSPQNGTSSQFNSFMSGSSSMMPGLLSPPSLLVPSTPLIFNGNGVGQTGSPEPAILAYQANLQQAFLQSAMAQNIQIQQQLLAQNQALQQLLQQRPSGAESGTQWNNTSTNSPTSVTAKAQVHRSGSPHSSFSNVMSELKIRKPPQEINTKVSSVPPPPPLPPPLELGDPSEERPFMDPYGRAKTVRIGKWRWPPPNGEQAGQEAPASFLQFKMKQRRKHSQELGENEINGMEWEEYEIGQNDPSLPHVNGHHQSSTPKRSTSNEHHRSSYKSLEVGASRPSPGSVGKLRISNEMKNKLELVTANHSLRSTTKPRPGLSSSSQNGGGKLDSERRALLQQQLAGRWGSVDSIATRAYIKEDHTEITETTISRHHVERVVDMRRPPPPPISPNNAGLISRTNSFYSQSNGIPPPPIQPILSRDVNEHRIYTSGSISPPNSDQNDFEESNELAGDMTADMDGSGPTTILYNDSTAAHFSYNRVNWKLFVRKEVFSPKENTSNPLALHLIFCQIVTDVFTKCTPRITADEQADMYQLLERHDVTLENMNSSQHKMNAKRAVVELAQHWILYFARMFSISCGHEYPEVEYLAISRVGFRLVKYEDDASRFTVISFHRLDEISELATAKGGQSIQIFLVSGECVPAFSPRARQIYLMLNAFVREAMPSNRFTAQPQDDQRRRNSRMPNLPAEIDVKSSRILVDSSEGVIPADDGQNSLFNFASRYFRKNVDEEGDSWSWKELAELVRYSPAPLSESLLKLDPQLNYLALECFECVMQYMGDAPITADMNEVKCVYTILMHCHKHELLRDEVYCQLMKQTCANRRESCQRGWRLLTIVAAYFMCSDVLRPVLLNYLESAAYDKRTPFHGTANVCLQNLRKTLRYGGRKNVPSVEEVTAVSAGRNSKRQIYRLPGGTETVINTKSTSVVDDVIVEMCALIDVTDPLEMEEFSLYCIVEGDSFTMPLARQEYILDVTTELHKNQQVFYLIFCRSVWYFPLRLDCQLYVQVLFNQIAPDYLEGLLLVLPNEQIPQEQVYEVVKLAALLHRAADMDHPPTLKETKFLLSKPALEQRDVRPADWVQMVRNEWKIVESLSSIQAKAQLLEILSKWPLFGSSFFAVKRGGDQQILALNKRGVHFLHLITHEMISDIPYTEVISTRKVRAESGTLYLELKLGNLFQQRVARLQTDQAHEIARLIRQYMTLHRQKSFNQ